MSRKLRQFSNRAAEARLILAGLCRNGCGRFRINASYCRRCQRLASLRSREIMRKRLGVKAPRAHGAPKMSPFSLFEARPCGNPECSREVEGQASARYCCADACRKTVLRRRAGIMPAKNSARDDYSQEMTNDREASSQSAL